MLGGLARIACLAQIELRQHGILRIEAHVHGQGFAQATQRDKGSRDGEAAKRDLRRQQDVAKRPAASCARLVGSTPPTLDGVIWIGLEYLPEWRHAEQDASERRDKQ